MGVERDAGRNDDSVEASQIDLQWIGERHARDGGPRFRSRLSHAVTSAPLASSASTVATPERARAEDGVAFAAKGEG